MIHLCKWSAWSDPVQTHDSGHKQQWRCCIACNKATFRTLWWDKQTPLAFVISALNAVRSAASLSREKGESK